jgi:hypothetical protein
VGAQDFHENAPAQSVSKIPCLEGPPPSLGGGVCACVRCMVSVRACDVWCLFVRACDVWCLTYRRALVCVPNRDGTPHATRLTVLHICPNGVEQSLLVWKNVVHYGKMSKHKGLLVKHLFWMDPIARTVRVFASAQSH